ncbi:MAG: glycosyltransferase family 2 protein [Acidobacteriaceae bacterium]
MVSIIIPTHRRPHLLRRAVLSVLAQTYPEIEVIVVADGPDRETSNMMRELDDARVRYQELAVNSGPAAARNAGVMASRGAWIAFLDDDDEWLPRKLEAQLAVADLADDRTMISCRTIYVHSGRQDVWPKQPIGEHEDIADYILLRRHLLGRPGVVPIQTLLVSRTLMLELPFTSHDDHEDWAWLLEVWHLRGARVRFVWEPLVTYNIVTDSLSRSRRMNWEDSLGWADSYRQWIGNAAYSSFLATKVALKAKRRGDWRGLLKVAGRIFSSSPSMVDLAFIFGMMVLPSSLLNAAWRMSLRSSRKSSSGTLAGAEQ